MEKSQKYLRTKLLLFKGKDGTDHLEHKGNLNRLFHSNEDEQVFPYVVGG